MVEGRLGPVPCSASHETKITAAQTDYSSSIFVYALAPEDREILVFRTSNLLTNPVAVSCDLETRIPLQTSIPLDSQPLDAQMKTIKGGILVDL